MAIKVKKEFEKTVVGFNNSAVPLGQRKDLHHLLIYVIGKNDEVINDHFANYFEELPTREELDKLIEGEKEKKVARTKEVTAPAKETPLQKK